MPSGQNLFGLEDFPPARPAPWASRDKASGKFLEGDRLQTVAFLISSVL
jgi:hypothetical protein